MPPPDPPAEAFERIFRECGPALRRLAAGYAADAGEQDDLFQEIMLALWRALPGFRGECSVRTFAFRVGHNRGLTYRSRRRRHDSLDLAEEVPDARADVAGAADRAAERERLLAAIRQLPIAQRQVVILHLEDLAHREIAEVVGTSENAVATRLTRARKALRRLLEEGGTP
jgi:RNA polymerase sigma-70 factor (ECF subfamily)